MSKDEFKKLFCREVRKTVALAEEQTGRSLPGNYQIILHGAGSPGVLLTADEALEEIWLGEDEFYQVVTLLVVGYSTEYTKIAVLVSGHTPVRFEETVNASSGNGPFQAVGADTRL